MTDFQAGTSFDDRGADALEARGAVETATAKQDTPPARKSVRKGGRRAAEVEPATARPMPHDADNAGRINSADHNAAAGSGGGHSLGGDHMVTAPSDPIAGRTSQDDQCMTAGSDAGRKRGVSRASDARVARNRGGQDGTDDLSSTAPSDPSAGHVLLGDQSDDAGGGEGPVSPAHHTASALPELCDAIRALQRKRRFCIVSQSRIDRACEAFIVQQLSPQGEQDPARRKAIWAQAGKLRREVEAGGGGLPGREDHRSSALSACRDVILQSAAARTAWDSMRRAAEAEMRRLARKLPVYPWAKGVAGFGDLGIAIVCAEAGDLSIYATKEKVWKRLGLAVIDGFRQQRRSDPDLAQRHGFSPPRRAEIWTIADSMFKHQWRGEKEGVPAHPTGPYGEVYARRKAHTEGREWTAAHRDNDARRIMTKFLVENYWRVWRGLPPLTPSQNNEPRTDVPQGADGERAINALSTPGGTPAPTSSGADASGERAFVLTPAQKTTPALETPGRATVAPQARDGLPVPEARA